MSILGMIGSQVVGGAIGLGIDALTRKKRYQEQYEQQEKLTNLQAQHNEDLMRKSAELNQQMALDMWNKTGPKQQTERLREAGLNVGLMYGGGGGGGATTTAAGTPSVSGSSAEMPSQMGLQLGMDMATKTANLELAKAQKENIQADTNLKNVNAGKTGGVDTQLANQTLEKLKLETQNQGVANEINKIEQQFKNIELAIKTDTWDETKAKIIAEAKTAVENYKQAVIQTGVDQATQDEKIKQFEQAIVQQAAMIEAIKEGTEFNYGTDADKVRWINAAMGSLKTVVGIGAQF